MRCLYFGCWTDDIGHFLYYPNGRKHYSATPEYPFEWSSLDGTYAPEGDTKDYRRRTKAGRQETEGLARVSHVNGWTLVGFWDRSADRRGASNSLCLVEGTHPFDKAVEIHKAAFPKIWNRFTFEVKEWDGA